MYKKFITPVYILNIIFQSVLNLLTPAALMFLLAYLIDRNTQVGGWIYALFTVFGFIIGLFSMISFILRACTALEALERQHAEAERVLTLKKKADAGSSDNAAGGAEEDSPNEQ